MYVSRPISLPIRPISIVVIEQGAESTSAVKWHDSIVTAVVKPSRPVTTLQALNLAAANLAVIVVDLDILANVAEVTSQIDVCFTSLTDHLTIAIFWH